MSIKQKLEARLSDLQAQLRSLGQQLNQLRDAGQDRPADYDLDTGVMQVQGTQ